MILSHQSLMQWAESNVYPFVPNNVRSASIDLTLGDTIRLPRAVYDPVTLDTDPANMWYPGIKFNRRVLRSGDMVLCHSNERVKIGAGYGVDLKSRSSCGRMGLEHLHSGWGDPGFEGQWTFEFFNPSPWPIVLEPGKRYLQMVVMQLDEMTDLPYGNIGRYQGQAGATPHRPDKKG